MNDREQLVDIIRHALTRLDLRLDPDESDSEEIAETIADEIISTGWPHQ